MLIFHGSLHERGLVHGIPFYFKHTLLLDKNIVKGITQVKGHSLRLLFCMFEISQVKYNSLDCHNVFGIFFLNCKVYMKDQSLTQIKNVFECSKHWNFESGLSFFFLKHHFFLPNVHHFFWKLEKILTLMIKIAKGFELMKNIFITDLSA